MLSVETLRCCATVLAALLLSASITVPFLGDRTVDVPWVPVGGAGSWHACASN